MSHINLITITYLITDHDRPPDRDRLADRGSHGVVHTITIALSCRGPHQHMFWHTLFQSGSHVVTYINLNAITCLITDPISIASLIAIALLIKSHVV